jgi:hypothetical protein
MTVDGKSYSQPITVRLDPRVKTPAVALTQLSTLTRSLYDGSVNAHAAANQARALVAQLDKVSGADAASLKAQVDSLAPAPAAGRGGRGGGGGRGAAAPAGKPTLDAASTETLGAAMAMQSADAAPTDAELTAAKRAQATLTDALGRWTKLKTTGLASLNTKLKASGQPAVDLPK